MLRLIIAFAVLLGLIPSGIVYAMARSVHPTRVDVSPYQRSAGIDADHQGLAWLRNRGLRCVIAESGPSAGSPTGPTLTIRWEGPDLSQLPQYLQIVTLRPDATVADGTVPWPDAQQALTVPVPRTGRWRVRVDGVIPAVDGQRRLRLVDIPLDVGM